MLGNDGVLQYVQMMVAHLFPKKDIKKPLTICSLDD